MQLVKDFTPIHYQLTLTFSREERVFHGSVTIHGALSGVGGSIALNQKGLRIHTVTIDGKSAAFKTTGDQLKILHNDLTIGDHIVVVTYKGTIADQMHGIYMNYYEQDGQRKELIATQFESHHAREAFPCIDEPAAKATFDVTLITEKDAHALGNMPVLSERIEDDRRVTTFATTPRMSTYLLAWIIGDMQSTYATSKNGITIGIHATPAQPASSLDYALEVSVKILDFFEEYFGVKYPLPKLDNVALPDFSSGAMENWGLITYRETALLADPATTGISTRQYVATVIAHEISHQWFGNLVTMQWWNDLWLNESFANLMEYVAVDALYPEWNMWLDFSTSESISSLRRDSIDGVQPVRVDIVSPDEINAIFDPSIVYAKGSRLIRMALTYIGEEAFRTGLKHYFNAYAYANTCADNLWDALGRASNKDIASLMNTWLVQSGYPVVTISSDDQTTRLSQQRFSIGPHSVSDTLWPIPLDANSPELPGLFDTPTLTILSALPGARLNLHDASHFITNYQGAHLESIRHDLRANHIDTVGRVQFLHEQSLLARGGQISSASLIPTLLAYVHETREPVWEIMGLVISDLKKFTDDDPVSSTQLRALSAMVARKQYASLGWNSTDDEPEETTKLRATIIGCMLYSEDQDIVDTAVKIYDNNKLTELDPELRSLIIGAKVRHRPDPHIIDQLISEYRSSPSSELRQDISAGLASSKDLATLSRLLEFTKDSSVVRLQDAIFWYVRLLRSNECRSLAWQWLRNNWPWVEESYGGDKSYDYFPRYAGAILCTETQLAEYQDFFGPMRSNPGLKRCIEMGINDIRGRVDLLAHDTAEVRSRLAQL